MRIQSVNPQSTLKALLHVGLYLVTDHIKPDPMDV